MSKRFFAKETGQINGLLDKGCSFEGKLTFDGTVQINGDFQGDIFSDGTLVVGRDARVNAKISVNTLIINGKVEGVVDAKKKVEVHSQAQLVGDVITAGFVIEEGGIFQGRCQMQTAETVRAVPNPDTGRDEEFFVPTNDDPMIM